jgi:putative SbcD/Mre11-related phosphoesterase
MNLSKNVAACDLFLIINDTLIISDIHTGYEESLHKQGYFIPKGNLSELQLRIEKAIKGKKIKRIILNGDLVHSFAKLSAKERYALKDFMTFLKKKAEIRVIKGNHDKVLSYLLPGIELITEYKIGDVLITHGDIINNHSNDKEIKTIIIGHEHPSISITSGPRSERYKCFLKGKYKAKTLIVMPSCNMLLEGTDILKEKLLSPYLKSVEDFEVFIIEDKIYDFGKVKTLKRKMSQ